MTKPVWFVLEVETGLIDGWYMNNSKADQMRQVDCWNILRPDYTHAVCYADAIPGYLYDDRCIKNVKGLYDIDDEPKSDSVEMKKLDTGRLSGGDVALRAIIERYKNKGASSDEKVVCDDKPTIWLELDRNGDLEIVVNCGKNGGEGRIDLYDFLIDAFNVMDDEVREDLSSIAQNLLQHELSIEAGGGEPNPKTLEERAVELLKSTGMTDSEIDSARSAWDGAQLKDDVSKYKEDIRNMMDSWQPAHTNIDEKTRLDLVAATLAEAEARIKNLQNGAGYIAAEEIEGIYCKLNSTRLDMDWAAKKIIGDDNAKPSAYMMTDECLRERGVLDAFGRAIY